jgi:hypothetical protein
VAERNPYLILGVDFAVSGDVARRAFAYAARRLRREGGAWEVEDLNWALHEIEELHANPADLVSVYRVPANPSAFEPSGEGLFRAPPVALARRTPQLDPESLVAVRGQAGRELDELLVNAFRESLALPENGYELGGANDAGT